MVDNALVTLVQRLDKNPDDAEAFQALSRSLMERRQYQQLATLAEKLAERRKDPRSAADLLYQAGDLWGIQLNRIDKAQADYKRAVEVFAGHVRAARRLREIYISQQRYPLAAPLFEAEIAATTAARDRAELLLEYVSVLEKLADGPGQIKALREVVALTPRDYDAARKLARLLLERAAAGAAGDEDRHAAAKLLGTVAQGLPAPDGLKYAEGALQVWPGEESAFKLMEAALTTAGKIDDLVRRQIEFLTANPSSKLATGIRKDLAARYERWGRIESAIETLVPLSGNDDEATKSLARLYEVSGRHAELAALLGAQPGPAAPGERVAGLVKRAALLEQAGDHAARITVLREIVAIDPTHLGALEQLEQDCRDRSAFDELRQVLYLQARAPGVSAELSRVRLREAALLSERLGDLSRAIECWQAVLAAEPAHPEAVESLDRILPYAERWDEYARWLEWRAGRVDTADERRALQLRLADVHREKRKDHAAECAVLTALFDMDPEDDTVASLLTDARVRAGDPGAALGVLRKRAASATDANAVARWSQLARRLELDGLADEALEAWRRVRTLDASQSAAWEAEERLLESAGRRPELLDALEAHAHHPGAAGVRAGELYSRAARLALDLGDRDRAVAQADRAFRLAPDDAAVADLYTNLCEAAGDVPRLRAVWSTRADLLPDGAPRVDLLRKIARSYARDESEALAAWQAVREASRRGKLGPDAEALETICTTVRANGDHRALAEALEELADTIEDPVRKRDALMERAELLAGPLDQPDEALAAFGFIVDQVEPGFVRAWSRLADMAARTKEPELQAEALEKCLELSRAPAERQSWALRLANVCENEIDDADRAADALAAWHRDGGDERAVLDRLEKLYEWLARWDDLVPMLEAGIAREDDPARRDAALLRWARIVGERMNEPRRAFERLAERYRGGGTSVLDGLRGLATRGDLAADLDALLRESSDEEVGGSGAAPPAMETAAGEAASDEEDAEPAAVVRTSAPPPPVTPAPAVSDTVERDDADDGDDADRAPPVDDDAEDEDIPITQPPLAATTERPAVPPPAIIAPVRISEPPAATAPSPDESARATSEPPRALDAEPPTLPPLEPELPPTLPPALSAEEPAVPVSSERPPAPPPAVISERPPAPPPAVISERPPAPPPPAVISERPPAPPPPAVISERPPAPPRVVSEPPAPIAAAPSVGPSVPVVVPPPTIVPPPPASMGSGLVLDDESSPVLDDVETMRIATRSAVVSESGPPPRADSSSSVDTRPQESSVSNDPPSGDSAETTNPRLTVPEESSTNAQPGAKPVVTAASVRPPKPAAVSQPSIVIDESIEDANEAVELESDELEVIDADEEEVVAVEASVAVDDDVESDDDGEDVITQTRMPAVRDRSALAQTLPHGTIPAPSAPRTAAVTHPHATRDLDVDVDDADQITPPEGLPAAGAATDVQATIPTPVPPPPTPADVEQPSIIVDDSVHDPHARDPVATEDVDPADRAYLRTPVPPAMPEPVGMPVFEPPPPAPQFTAPPLFGAPPPGFPPPPAGFPPAPTQGPPPGFGGPPPGFGGPPPGFGGPPPGFGGPPPGFGGPPPGFGGPPPGFGGPPPGFGGPPPGFGGPPPGFGGPPPGFGGPPPGFGGPPPGFGGPPAGFPPAPTQGPPPGFGGPPPGFGGPPPGFGGPPPGGYANASGAFPPPPPDYDDAPAFSSPAAASEPSPVASGGLPAGLVVPVVATPRRIYQRTMATMFEQSRVRAGLPARR